MYQRIMYSSSIRITNKEGKILIWHKSHVKKYKSNFKYEKQSAVRQHLS